MERSQSRPNNFDSDTAIMGSRLSMGFFAYHLKTTTRNGIKGVFPDPTRRCPAYLG